MQPLREAHELHPADPHLTELLAAALQNHGNRLAGAGSHAEAVEAYRVALAQDPKAVELYGYIALVYGLLGNWAAAAESYTQYMELRPGDLAARLNFGDILWRKEDFTGVGYEWHMRYPGSDGKPNTGDDGLDKRHLHLPAHTEVKLRLHSMDYLYSFALPHLDPKEIAIPDLEFSLSFTTGPEGTFDLLGDQLCGYAHPELMGKLIILSSSVFAERMSRLGKVSDQ